MEYPVNFIQKLYKLNFHKYTYLLLDSKINEFARRREHFLAQYLQRFLPKFQTYYPKNHVTYIKPFSFTLLEISLYVERKKERRNKNRPLFRSRSQLPPPRWKDEETGEKRRGQYSRRKEFDEREFSLCGGRTCKRRKEFFLTPVIPFIARGTARHSAPACNGPGYWRVAVLMNFGVHVLRETRGTSRMPPDASATLARYWRGNSRNPLWNAKG